MCRSGPLSDDQRGHLTEGLRSYDPHGHYDEVFDQVGARVRAHASAGKCDIGAIVFWKRIPQGRWSLDFLQQADDAVHSITAAAFSAGLTDKQRLVELAVLPGFKTQMASVASAVLAAWDPENYPVTDRRARPSLRRFLDDDCECDLRKYPIYAQWVRHLRDDLNVAPSPHWSARDVDKALYKLG